MSTRLCPKCEAPLLPTNDRKSSVCSSGFVCGGILNIQLSSADIRVNGAIMGLGARPVMQKKNLFYFHGDPKTGHKQLERYNKFLNEHPGGSIPRDCLWGLDDTTIVALQREPGE